MIYWHEYKEYKKTAELLLGGKITENVDLKIEVLKCTLGKVPKEQSIENIINILSNGEHYKR